MTFLLSRNDLHGISGQRFIKFQFFGSKIILSELILFNAIMRFLQKMAEELLENSIWKFKSRDLVAFFFKNVSKISYRNFRNFIRHVYQSHPKSATLGSAQFPFKFPSCNSKIVKLLNP